MRVLVTRPLRQGERTARRLRELGHDAVLLPLFEPVHDSRAAISALERSQGPIAVTSAEAVRAAAASPELKRHLQREVYAVGEASAEEARAAGFETVFASSGNGSELAELIAAKAPEHIVYLAGWPRAETFEERTRELGIAMDIAECYGMDTVEPDRRVLDTLIKQRPDAILFYSAETSSRFFQLFGNAVTPALFADARLLCLSEAVAAAVPLKFRAHIRVAAMPDEQSLLSLL